MTREYVRLSSQSDGGGITKALSVLGGGIVAVVTATYYAIVGVLVIVVLIILVALLVSRLFGCGCRDD